MNEREAQEWKPTTSLSQLEAAPESPTSGAWAGDGQEHEPAASSSYTDIVIFCHPRNVSNLVQSFEEEIKHAAGELPMLVFWSGVSGVLHQGVIVLEWEGKVSPAFLHNLSIDHEIFDYVVYEYGWTRTDECSGEQTEAIQESETEMAGRQLV